MHALGQGTDAGTVWFLVAVGLVGIPALGLLALRMSGEGGSTAAAGAVRRA